MSTNPAFNKAVVRVNIFKHHRQARPTGVSLHAACSAGVPRTSHWGTACCAGGRAKGNSVAFLLCSAPHVLRVTRLLTCDHAAMEPSSPAGGTAPMSTQTPARLRSQRCSTWGGGLLLHWCRSQRAAAAEPCAACRRRCSTSSPTTARSSRRRSCWSSTRLRPSRCRRCASGPHSPSPEDPSPEVAAGTQLPAAAARVCVLPASLHAAAEQETLHLGCLPGVTSRSTLEALQAAGESTL